MDVTTAVVGAGTEKLGHRPELDGLRGVAVLAVVLGHAFTPTGRLANFGVEVFFVLSGFLITSLLLEERGQSGQVGLGGFYVRRARRLLPALFLLLTVVGLRAWAIGDAETLRGVFHGFTYSTNIARVGHESMGELNHLWSLAVEEHFYLLWPLVVIVGKDARGVLRLAGLGMVASLLWRVVLQPEGWARLYYGTDTRASSLLLGACVACLWRLGWRADTRLVGATLIGLVLVPGLSLHDRPNELGFAVCALGAALLILGSVTRPGGLLSSRGLVAAGGISYAWYLWHAIFTNPSDPVVEGAVGVVASLAVACASTYWWEARWRSALPPRRIEPGLRKGARANTDRLGAVVVHVRRRRVEAPERTVVVHEV